MQLNNYDYFDVNYYGIIDEDYINAVKQPIRTMKLKMEILDYYENPIGEIINDISQSSVGSININREQGCRKSCSFSMIDKSKKYIPSQNSVFWYNRKFKLYIGIVCNDNDTENPYQRKIYWFSKGVFVTKKASGKGDIINIEGIDKYGFLNGELKTGMCMLDTKSSVTYVKNGDDSGKYVKNTIMITDLIEQTLLLDIGNGRPLDPIKPIIDPVYCNQSLYQDITINKGSYIGELFDKIADMCGAFMYYDNNGRLHMEQVFNNFTPSYYRHLTPIWTFNDITLSKNALQVAYEYDGFNIVTVATDNTSGVVYSYTAKNKNPMSPVCIQNIGERGYTGGEVKIALGDIASSGVTGKERCRQYAEHLLLQNICMTTNESFTYPLIPHFNVDNTIKIINEGFNFNAQLFLIQGLTIPLGLNDMTVNAVNLEWCGINGNL